MTALSVPYARRAVVSNPFLDPFTVTVLDPDALPISGVPVDFLTPPTGPSAFLDGNRTKVTVQTDTEGRAVSPGLTANSLPGRYNILVQVDVLTASLSYTNLPATPTLAIAKNGSSLLVTWPADALGYTLQQSTNLVAPAVWATLPATAEANDFQFIPAPGDSAAFFRLRFVP